MGKIIQTAGRNALGEFAPEFAHFNDDVLFGENWNNQDIDVKTRSIITVVALMASGITDSSLRYHLQNAKNHGVTQKEIAAVITHAAFYAGWPKAWAVFNLAKEVWETGEGDLPYEEEAMRAHAKKMVFPIGAPNDGFAQYFSGRSFLAPISTSQVGIFNVTFEPGCRNNWHIHHAKSGGGQILVCVAGRGYYQVEGKEAVEMKPGDCINIPAEVKHWHGAAPDEWFSHLAIEVPGENSSNEWLEQVSDEVISYYQIKQGTFDTISDCKYSIPSYLDIGRLYSIMIEDCAEAGAEVQELIKIFSSFISDKISDFKTDLYYQNPDYLEWSYREGKLLD